MGVIRESAEGASRSSLANELASEYCDELGSRIGGSDSAGELKSQRLARVKGPKGAKAKHASR